MAGCRPPGVPKQDESDTGTTSTPKFGNVKKERAMTKKERIERIFETPAQEKARKAKQED